MWKGHLAPVLPSVSPAGVHGESDPPKPLEGASDASPERDARSLSCSYFVTAQVGRPAIVSDRFSSTA